MIINLKIFDKIFIRGIKYLDFVLECLLSWLFPYQCFTSVMKKELVSNPELLEILSGAHMCWSYHQYMKLKKFNGIPYFLNISIKQAAIDTKQLNWCSQHFILINNCKFCFIRFLDCIKYYYFLQMHPDFFTVKCLA